MASRSKGIVVPIVAKDETQRAFEQVQASLARLEAVNQALGRSGSRPGEALAAGMGHATPQIAAASGAIRELEGNLPIRAVERFLTTTLGLGPALAKAFPVVGALAFGGVLLENVEKVVEFAKESHKAAQTSRDDFDQITGSVRKTGIELDIANDKARNAIATLEHKPENLLQLALDEDRKELIDIATEARNASHSVDDLLKKDGVGIGRQLENLALGKNISITTGSEKVIRDAYSQIKTAARTAQNEEDSASPGDAEAVKLRNRTKLTGVYADAIAKVNRELQSVYNRQRKDTDNTDFSSHTEILEDSLADLQARKHNLTAGFEHGDLAGQQGADEAARKKEEADRRADAAKRRADELAQKKKDAADRLAAAQRGLDDEVAKEGADAAKASTEAQLAALDESHKALLISDENYFRQKADVQDAALLAEKTSLVTQQTDLQKQINALKAENDTGTKATDRDAKVLELRTKQLALEAQIAKVTGEQAKNYGAMDEALDALARKRLADEDAIAAKLEGARGGSTAARSTQSKDEYKVKRQQLVAETGSEDNPAVRNLDTQQGLDQDSITAKGAEQNFGAGDAQRRSARQGIDDAEKRGQLSAQQAQQQKIALDREEAAAMQPILAAYEQLAKDGDLAALSKVEELKTKIAELSNPVNQVAADVRSQLDSAFEQAFSRIDSGRKALKQLGETLRSDVLKDSYKQFVQPIVQQATGALIPNKAGSQIPNGAALGGILQKIPGLGNLPGFGKGSKDKSGITIKIINKSATPLQATSGSADSPSDYADQVINIIMDDVGKGGTLSKLFQQA